MDDFRCQCKKIVFQVDGDNIIIKCRHCKRYIHIYTNGLIGIEYSLGSQRTALQEVSLESIKKC